MDDTELMDLAREVIDCYGDLAGVRMALVTGSVARGIADERSDVDVMLVLDRVDSAALADSTRLADLGGERLFGMPRGDGFFEKYRQGARHVDVDCIDRARLETAATTITAGAVDPDSIKVATALADAVAVRGASELSGWQQRLSFSTALARAEVALRSTRLVSTQALHELTLARGDAISFARRVSGVVLDAIALLAAANRVFVPVDDPKWIPWHLARLDEAPRDFGERAARALEDPSPEALSDLDAMLVEVLDIVDRRVPGADTRVGRYALTLRPTAQD